MKPDNWNRFAAGLLAILLCLCSFSMPAFAAILLGTVFKYHTTTRISYLSRILCNG